MAEGEWVVAHEAFVKDLAIAAAGFLGVGEVAGEIAADELLAGNAGDLYGGLINVGDFAIGADGDEGSRLASMRLRAYWEACFWAVVSRAAAKMPRTSPRTSL